MALPCPVLYILKVGCCVIGTFVSDRLNIPQISREIIATYILRYSSKTPNIKLKLSNAKKKKNTASILTHKAYVPSHLGTYSQLAPPHHLNPKKNNRRVYSPPQHTIETRAQLRNLRGHKNHLHTIHTALPRYKSTIVRRSFAHPWAKKPIVAPRASHIP